MDATSLLPQPPSTTDIGSEPYALPLEVAEQVLITAIRTHVTVRSCNADALVFLNVVGPRNAFPSITDAALHHMLWIDLDSICHAGDTELLGRLLDPTLPKPIPQIRALRHSPFVLARASEVGHLDVLGYWLRLACRHEVVPLTLTMVRRAISAAARTGRIQVLEWWFDAILRLFPGKQMEACWDIAFEAAQSKSVLEQVKLVRIKDIKCHLGDHEAMSDPKLEELALPDYDSRCRSILRAHKDKNVGVVDWWFSRTPRLRDIRFLLPHMMQWKQAHFRYILDFFCSNELGVPTKVYDGSLCQRLCWHTAVPLLFIDQSAWRRHDPKTFTELTHKITCSRCLDIIFNRTPSCRIAECVHDHCRDCDLPTTHRNNLARYTATHRSIDLMCQHGHAEGLRAWLQSDAKLSIPPHALQVASKHGHVGILHVWLQEYKGNDYHKYPVQDGVGIDVLAWLLEHDVDRKLLRWMSMDEASRAGQTHVLDWWFVRFKEGKVPVLRFSYKALHFKSYESGVKSLRWWLQSGLLDDLGRHAGGWLHGVGVWRYCCLDQFELVEMLVAGGIPVSFDPDFQLRISPFEWQSQEDVHNSVAAWWARNGMSEKLGTENHQSVLDGEKVMTEWVNVLKSADSE